MELTIDPDVFVRAVQCTGRGRFLSCGTYRDVRITGLQSVSARIGSVAQDHLEADLCVGRRRVRRTCTAAMRRRQARA